MWVDFFLEFGWSEGDVEGVEKGDFDYKLAYVSQAYCYSDYAEGYAGFAA